MAVLHEGTPSQAASHSASTYLKYAVISGAIALAGWLYWACLILEPHRLGAPKPWALEHGFVYLLVWGAIGYFAKHMWHKYRACHAGIQSKSVGANALERLPDSYHVFTNVRLDERNLLDAVAVGDNGVFLVLMKGMNGEIEPSRGKEWTQHKVGREGTEYENTIRSPLPKLTALTHVLKDFLRDNGVNAWIDGSVFFTNARLLEEVGRCYESSSDLRGHIESFQPPFPLKTGDRDKILRLLDERVA